MVGDKYGMKRLKKHPATIAGAEAPLSACPERYGSVLASPAPAAILLSTRDSKTWRDLEGHFPNGVGEKKVERDLSEDDRRLKMFSEIK
ncbi:hypothetical protein TNCV_2899621 [Trichonephila clavipes]|nr:hypothetical protein TNCV_2899621 [Trichonephila clavipes]